MNHFKKYLSQINRNTIINVVLTVLVLSVSFYLISGNISFGEDPLSIQPLWLVILLTSLQILFGGALIVYNRLVNKFKPSLPIAIFLLCLLICNTVTTFALSERFVMPTQSGHFIDHTFEVGESFKFVLAYFGVIFMVYIIIDILPKIFKSYDLLYLMCFLLVIFALVSLICSYVLNFDFYSTLIPKLLNKESSLDYPRGFYPNKNSFAVIVFIGMCSALFIHLKNNRWWWLVIAAFFLSNILIIFCKALTIVAPFVLIGYLLARFFLTFNEHKKRNIITLGCISGGVVLFFASLLITSIFVDNFIPYLVDCYFGGVSDTFNSRVDIWKATFDILNHSNWISGLGFHSFGYRLDLYFKYTYGLHYGMFYDVQIPTIYVLSAHNAFIEALGNGGIILLVAVLIMFAYFIYLAVKEFKLEKSLIIFDGILVTGLLIIMVIESGSFILPFTMDYAFFSAIILIPLMNHKKDIQGKFVFK